MGNEFDTSGYKIVKEPGSVVLPLGKSFLIMIPSTGAWAILDEEALSFYISLGSETVLSSSEIEKLSKLLKRLQSAGIIHFGASQHKHASARKNLHFVPITLVVMHLSNNCNLSCKYCQVSTGLKDMELMDFETAKLIVDRLLEFPQTEFHMQFYGGEPLISFPLIRKIVEYCKKAEPLRKRFHFVVQTNGTLFNNEMAYFFAEHDFKIGISIDGPAFINDALRISGDRNGSYDKILAGIEILRHFGLRFGVIAVLTKLHLEHMEAVLSELRALGVEEFKLNPMVRVGRGQKHASLSITFEEYFSCLQLVLSSIIEAKGAFRESNLKYLVSNIIFPFRISMCHGAPCGAGSALLAFDTDGSIYPCDRFIGIQRWRISTGQELKLLNIADVKETSNVIEALYNRNSSTLGECGNCKWRAFCSYGCPAEQYLVSENINSVPFLCSFYKLMFPYLFHLIETNKEITRYVLGDYPGP